MLMGSLKVAKEDMGEGRRGGRGRRRGNYLLGGVGKKIVGDTADLVPHTGKVWSNSDPMNERCATSRN